MFKIHLKIFKIFKKTQKNSKYIKISRKSFKNLQNTQNCAQMLKDRQKYHKTIEISYAVLAPAARGSLALVSRMLVLVRRFPKAPDAPWAPRVSSSVASGRILILPLVFSIGLQFAGTAVCAPLCAFGFGVEFSFPFVQNFFCLKTKKQLIANINYKIFTHRKT